MHSLLIAFNRGFSVLFPLHYDQWWTRRVTLAATLVPWTVNAILMAVDVAVTTLVTHDNSVFGAIYTRLQPATTYPSVTIYAVSLVWVLVRWLMGLGKLS